MEYTILRKFLNVLNAMNTQVNINEINDIRFVQREYVMAFGKFPIDEIDEIMFIVFVMFSGKNVSSAVDELFNELLFWN